MTLKQAHIIALVKVAIGRAVGIKKGRTVLIRGANTAPFFFLEKNGLIERKESEEKVKFSLTKKGRIFLEEMRFLMMESIIESMGIAIGYLKIRGVSHSVVENLAEAVILGENISALREDFCFSMSKYKIDDETIYKIVSAGRRGLRAALNMVELPDIHGKHEEVEDEADKLEDEENETE